MESEVTLLKIELTQARLLLGAIRHAIETTVSIGNYAAFSRHVLPLLKDIAGELGDK